jgi:hypothetical protein
VGESINVPYPSIDSSNLQITGDLTVTFNSPEDLSVPAGTYHVFKIDLKSNNLKMTLTLPDSNYSLISPNSLTMELELNAHMYLEYGTMRQIQSTMQITGNYQLLSIANMTFSMSSDMTLKEHLTP